VPFAVPAITSAKKSLGTFRAVDRAAGIVDNIDEGVDYALQTSQQTQVTVQGNSVTLYHGTSSNRASKIVGNQFYETQGFKKQPVFFAEDYPTAEYFAYEKMAARDVPNIPKSATVIEFKLSESLANDVGLGANNRRIIGQDNYLPFPDIPGGSGYERITLNSSDLEKFNNALKSGNIQVRRLKVR